MTDTLLVTGASGHLGRAVVNHLLNAQKVAPGSIIAATRNPESLADLAALGVTVRAADFDDQASLEKAFKGADRVLIISTGELDLKSDRRLRQHQAAVAAAKTAGVSHLLYTSMPNPEPGSPVLFAGDHYGTEQAIKASGIPHTIFRNGWYQENLFMALPHAISSGKWYTSSADGRVAHGARDDMAAAIAAGLASGSTESRIYTLTGPHAYTTGEIAALVTEVTGKALEVIQVPDEALTEGVKAAGLPEDFARIVVSFDANTRSGRIAMVTDTVETLSGRKPRTLKQFLEANKAALLG
ncbi:SDR family oxidoreductase [Mesorhizobium sp. M1C.F.Ca.ET.193.01.1.1]|uniref:SDR family oxidoreductase n=1 Tax=unclassified Mesorhizobium TaxID=325217 RepID=UPI000FD1E369|nr:MULTISPECIES: SDR family oxidoreductase [unclassified Mesorhizobium]TGT02663.1 SDR family oxidoreductase [bacterium M00.F.Ca.ET.177.01.1.1]TGQ55523.1 SDR family oxidoreductase [Mesorhizobium sp. M1C.F.Ca.ET.210.01.1.1]TGQ73978.1 SDR family oxidoreductase [Mesorhizobium sp. M1C.F.Ca.ET.212.01.1.1]TGR12607.1 SDR family oxidoreductase [Mesorhizobium sp. M1C.F.Ca.ET.204.01.1.1]TGR32566.1 SDR family oxidoreductase [Mesorhizobium sp. M1C.F.Ca.ET.196.01.1.1]